MLLFGSILVYGSRLRSTTLTNKHEKLVPFEFCNEHEQIGTQKESTTVRSNSTGKRVFTFAELENALNEPNVKCGRVPIFEKLYHRNINESLQVEPGDIKDYRILHGLDARP